MYIVLFTSNIGNKSVPASLAVELYLYSSFSCFAELKTSKEALIFGCFQGLSTARLLDA